MKFLVIVYKELVQFFRNYMLLIFVMFAFTMDIHTVGGGIKVQPRNISIGYVDFTRGANSIKIISHLHKPEFKEPIRFLNENDLKKAILNKKIMVGLIFDRNFDKTKKLEIIVDSTAAAQAELAVSYIQHILLDNLNLKFPIKIKIHKLFNQNSTSQWFMSLSELLSVITMLTLLLSAVSFVREREKGTWDIMLLTPVDSKLIIFAKIFAQILIILIGVFVAVGVVLFGAFNTPFRGNLLLFFIATFIYAFSISGIGLFIAAISSSVIQVAELSFLIMMPLIFLSGAWTPIYAMSKINQILAFFSPLKYYIEISQDLFFRGSDFSVILPNLIIMAIIGIVLFYFGYKKIGKLF